MLGRRLWHARGWGAFRPPRKGRSGCQPALAGGRKSQAGGDEGVDTVCTVAAVAVDVVFPMTFLSLFHGTAYIGHQLFQLVLGGKCRHLCVHSQFPIRTPPERKARRGLFRVKVNSLLTGPHANMYKGRG